MEIENFLPKFPNIINFEEDILNPYSGDFNDVIVTKKEFETLKLSETEKPVKKGEQYMHQKIVSRFMSSVTPYNELLLFHEMGTGKTCTAIGAIEQLRFEKKSSIKGAMVFVKGTNLIKNFIQELFFTCTDGRYIPDNWDRLSDLQRIHRLRKNYSQFYQFHTFETFARELSRMTDAEITSSFSNRIMVIDEVHNMREKDEPLGDDPDTDDVKKLLKKIPPTNVYKQFHRLLHTVKECKVLLMTGTAMKDDVIEFASVMNLILPMDQQFVTDTAFTQRYFTDGIFKKDKVEEFTHKIKGRVSYLKSMASEVRKVFIGQRIGNLKHFLVLPDRMSEFQTRHYNDAMAKDKRERNIFTNARQAVLFVFPDGTVGNDGFNQERYITKRAVKGGGTTYQLGSALKSEINGSVTNLARFSSKYATTIGIINDTFPSKSLVYCEFVNGSGAILFAKLLDQFGFSAAQGNERTKGRRYALLTNQTTTDKSFYNLIKRFNEPDNIDGEFIGVIIGSRVISEGFTFKNIRREFILTPHWNYSETAQVIARGWRLGSHEELIKRGDANLTVDIFQQVSLPRVQQGTGDSSIDLVMYETSEKKDVAMKQIEFIVKQSAFDCPLTFARNKITGYDGMRECDYTSCDYKCDGAIGPQTDTLTYNIYHIMTNQIKDRLTTHFRKHFSLKIADLMNMFSHLDVFEVTQSLKTLIERDSHFTNKYGSIGFMRIQGDTIFLVSDGHVPNDDILVEYYFKNLITQNGDTFDQIVTDFYHDRIPDMIDSLFKFPDQFITIVSALPEAVQRLLVQGAIDAEIQGIEKNKNVRDIILDYFRGFYGFLHPETFQGAPPLLNHGVWVIWLYKDTLGVLCRDTSEAHSTGGRNDEAKSNQGGEWIDCRTKTETYQGLIEDYVMRRREHLLRTPVGFYGLENPQLKEFCLRDVREAGDDVGDLRRVVIGRRCTDHSKPILLDIISNKMRLTFPRKWMDDEDDQDMKNMINRIVGDYSAKERSMITVPTDRDDMRRFLFFERHTRKDMCDLIQSWMRKNNLIERSFDCGTSVKQRVRMMV